MVYLHNPISLCSSVDQIMGNTVDLVSKPKRNNTDLQMIKKSHDSRKRLKFPFCNRSPYAAIDVLILIAVITASGILLYPYVKFVVVNLIEFIIAVAYLAEEDETLWLPIVYGSMAISASVAAIASWLLLTRTSGICIRPHLDGLKEASELDIQLETEERVKNSRLAKNRGLNNKLLELRHRELESELKKMAPPNGRAVLVFKAKCGCCVGRLEVPGPKRHRKIKK